MSEPLMSRRALLRGLGATMALPFMESLDAWSGAAAAPIRFAALFMPNGVNHNKWDFKAAGPIEKFTPILSPLESLKRHVTVIQGVDNADRGHAAGTSSLLTGRRVRKTAKSGEVHVGNPSIDQIIAVATRSGTVLPSLELAMHAPQNGATMSGYSAVYRSYVSWKDAGTPVAFEVSPERAFSRLFRGVNLAGSASGAPAPGPDRSVLDLVLEDARSLQGRVGLADRQKLDEYLTAVREVEQRVVEAADPARTRTVPPPVQAELKGLDEKVRAGESRPDYRDQGRLLMDILALAFWSNTTRAATLMFGDGLHNRNMSFLEGVDGSHHSISHHGNKPDKLAKFATINRFFVEQLAYLLGRLSKMPEGPSNVLENSIVLFGSNISAGQDHSGKDIPLVLAGNAGGQIKGGRVLMARRGQIGDVLRSILQVMGISAKIGEGSGLLAGLVG